MPRPVKYSDLAKKTTLRGSGSGAKKWSEKDRWLLARIAGPVRGTFSVPSAHGLNRSLNIGARTTCVDSPRDRCAGHTVGCERMSRHATIRGHVVPRKRGELANRRGCCHVSTAGCGGIQPPG